MSIVSGEMRIKIGDKDWSQGCAGIGEVGDWQNKLKKSHPGWNDVLHRVKKMPASNIKTL